MTTISRISRAAAMPMYMPEIWAAPLAALLPPRILPAGFASTPVERDAVDHDLVGVEAGDFGGLDSLGHALGDLEHRPAEAAFVTAVGQAHGGKYCPAGAAKKPLGIRLALQNVVRRERVPGGSIYSVPGARPSRG